METPSRTFLTSSRGGGCSGRQAGQGPSPHSPPHPVPDLSRHEQAASSEQASALDLTLVGIATGPTNSEYNLSAFPTFMEWNKVKVAADPSVDRPRPKAPELVSVHHMPWYPIQPICVKKRLDHWEHRDLEKLVE